MASKDRPFRTGFANWLADEHLVAGWEKLLMWLLLATCVGANVFGMHPTDLIQAVVSP